MLELKGIKKDYLAGENTVHALKGIDLRFRRNEFVSILGPSGCGKTTMLNIIGGLDQYTEGDLVINGRSTKDFKDRDWDTYRNHSIGFVFQSYALFPHMTVFDNVAFGLKMRKLDKAVIQRDVMQMLKLVDLEGFENRYPREMSGGQRQRVALARAMVIKPDLMLFDEPLSNLDAKLRVKMRVEIRRIQQELGFTAIYVTHDQEEALTMSDTVVVMDKGRIQQIGTPEDIYNEPKNAFVADFIGESNILNGTMVRDRVVKMYGKEFPCVDGGFAENEPVDVVIRPEDIDIVPVEQGQLVGTVTNVTFKGMQYDIIVDFRGFKWLIQTTDHSPVGARIGVKIDPEGFHIMKKSEYSGMFGDYSSYSEEYEELADAGAEPEEEESEDEE